MLLRPFSLHKKTKPYLCLYMPLALLLNPLTLAVSAINWLNVGLWTLICLTLAGSPSLFVCIHRLSWCGRLLCPPPHGMGYIQRWNFIVTCKCDQWPDLFLDWTESDFGVTVWIKKKIVFRSVVFRESRQSMCLLCVYCTEFVVSLPTPDAIRSDHLHLTVPWE